MDVHHVDHNHGNNVISNFRPLCQICHAVMHVGFPGELMPKGELIIFPSLSQAEINVLAWGVLRAADSTEYRKTAKRIFREIRDEGRLLREKNIPGFSGSLSVWSAFNRNLYKRESTAVLGDFDSITADIRLLPSLASYQLQASYLARQTLGALEESEWTELLT